jgi:hypothetical protein
MFYKMPFVLMALIAAIILLNNHLPLPLKEFLYAISLTIKEGIGFLLPFLVFGLLFNAALKLARDATRVIGLILLGVCCSNFISTFLSHYVGSWIYSFDLSILMPTDDSGLKAAWQFALPKLIGNDKAMLVGLILGVAGALLKSKFAHKLASQLEMIISNILRDLSYVIPLFIAGFIVKLQHDGVVLKIARDYSQVFLVVAFAQLLYLTLSYWLLNNRKLSEFKACIKNMLPAAICGFSTMSSAASMPLTIMGAEKNVKNKELVRSVIPATVNIHLVGDCFAIPIFAYAVLKNYGVAEPALITYLIFAFYFVLAKFSVAAIPGGGIIVMLPILEAYLGFHGDMLSLITALYILFDPVITCANVLGNGAFVKMIDRVIPSLSSRKATSST